MGKGLEIIFCYAHEDEELRRGLERQLIPLRLQSLITIWYDQEISPGVEWESEIDKHLKTAHIILLLISSAFLNSEYCYSIEMKQALERHQRGEVRVIPIILRPTLWQGTPLGKLQALPTGAVPVTDPSWHDLDRAYLDVVQGILKVVEELGAGLKTESEKNGKKHHKKMGKFACIEPQDLGAIPVMIQALDNQWLPRSCVNTVTQMGYLTQDIDKQRVKFARSEYIRALINNEQLVIPLHFIYNNFVIYQDYLQKGQKRESFQTLLESGVIIPYLVTEKNPADQPDSNLDTHGWGAWQQLCQETSMHCLRLSWDETENERLVHTYITRRFAAFAMSLQFADIDTLLRDFRLDESVKRDLRKRLIEMNRFTGDFYDKEERFVSRADLYRAFVIEGDNPADREYDSSKPFASEIKQLIDLMYNCLLPDTINGYLITPVDSLSRSTLQEVQRDSRLKEISGEELLRLLQRIEVNLVGRRLNVESLDTLSLLDVCEIRRMDEWNLYLKSLQQLLMDPLNMANGGVTKVYESYNRLVQQTTGLIAGRERGEQVLTSWLPTIELVFSIDSAVLSYIWTRNGPSYRLSGQIFGPVATKGAQVTARLIIRDRAEKQVQQGFSMSIDFIKCRMDNAKKQWEEITRQVKQYPGYKD